MNLTQDRLRQVGWFAVLLTCFTLTVILTFKVNAVKSQVRLAERQIAATQQQKLFLETEFEARASQQQLKSLNDVDFGYQAPTAGQYLEGERQLAALGKPRGAGAPSPIRVASAGDNTSVPTMVSPLTGKAMAAEPPKNGKAKPVTATNLSDRLSHVEDRGSRSE